MWPGKVFVLRTAMKRRLKASKRLESRLSREIDEKFSSQVNPPFHQNTETGEESEFRGWGKSRRRKFGEQKIFHSFRLFRAHCEQATFYEEQKWVTEIGKFGPSASGWSLKIRSERVVRTPCRALSRYWVSPSRSVAAEIGPCAEESLREASFLTRGCI